MSRIVRVVEIARITEYTDDLNANPQVKAPDISADLHSGVPALPRAYHPETDSPLAGRTSHRLKWTGPIDAAEREQIRQRVEASRPRRRRWFR